MADERPIAVVAREMREYYQRTGTYRATDLIRVLGDPTKGVVINAR